MPEYNEKWRYVILCWKILILEVTESDVIACIQLVFTN